MISYFSISSIWAVAYGYSASPVVRDYCMNDIFRPDCGSDVIMINYARYGRMKLGTCVTEDYGKIGCHENVTNVVSQECFAKTACEIAVYDRQIFHASACGELHSYLEVSHTCLQVITSPKDHCDDGDLLRITSPPLGYLASTTSRETGCGSQTSPWLIESPDGKPIIITLLDLTYSGEGGSTAGSICLVYAQIKEAGQERSVTVCGGQSRERFVYQSDGSAIEITIISRERQFVLKYEFTGCPNMDPRNGITLTRSRNVTTAECEQTGHVSTFKCTGTEWVGQLPNCTEEDAAPDPDINLHVSGTKKPSFVQPESIAVGTEIQSDEGEVVAFNFESITWGMVLIVVGIITGGIVACVFIIAVVYLKRKSIECKAPILVPRPVSEAGYEVCDFDISRGTSSVFHDGYRTVPKDYTPMMNGGTMKYKPPGVWERPLPAEPSNV